MKVDYSDGCTFAEIKNGECGRLFNCITPFLKIEELDVGSTRINAVWLTTGRSDFIDHGTPVKPLSTKIVIEK